jgi:transcriptional regulator CtsR
MNLSTAIADMLLEMLEQTGNVEIQRNELAQSLGCVPSQINYVIASRFTPEQGYLVESRRGGGGYVRIRRVKLEHGVALIQLINAVGERIDEATCRAHISNLQRQGLFGPQTEAVLLAATGDSVLRGVQPGIMRDRLRAALFKQMLLAIQNN